MTRAEILDCLTDRPCDSCKFHESGRCERWNCVFEEKPDDCEDAISRQAVLDVTERELFKGDAISKIEKLPPVTPIRKMGRWLSIGPQGEIDGQIVRAFTCSECGAISIFRLSCGNIVNGDLCPNCMAKMEVEENG